jgi:hypothetical protein
MPEPRDQQREQMLDAIGKSYTVRASQNDLKFFFANVKSS